MDDLIRFYFMLGLQHLEIKSCLSLIHNIEISERSLKRKLRKMNLYRRKYFTDLLTVCDFIEENVQCYSQLHGYRWMHLKCLQNNLVVTQETVRLILQIIDPIGVQFRTRRRLRRRQYNNKEPNFLWHVDCYDKLKPFGICVSGCIDGFSRYIIWLKASNNTNNPRIIGGYYMECVRNLGGCPQTVRTDLGTENVVLEQIQSYLRSDNELTSLPPFLYGSSPSNQRIEAWWAMLRKHHAQFWLNLFHQLKDEGLFAGSFFDKSLIQFCFLTIIQNELEEVVTEWNMHIISASKNSVSPKGRPFIMYHMPAVYDTVNYLKDVAQEDILTCNERCVCPEKIPCDSDLYQLAALIMDENNLTLPQNPYDAVDLYITLREELLRLL